MRATRLRPAARRQQLRVGAVLLALFLLTFGSGRSSAYSKRFIFYDSLGREIRAIDNEGIVTLEAVSGAPDPANEVGIQAPKGDPDLEKGWPVKAMHTAGNYQGGPANHTLVGNIDGDPELEVLVAARAEAPVYAWNHNGTPVTGWPVKSSADAYINLGALAATNPPALQVFIAISSWCSPVCNRGLLGLYGANGQPLPGWPIPGFNYMTAPGASWNVGWTRAAEIFIGLEDWRLHGYAANASELPGWPVFGDGGQERHTPAIADLDGDGDLEIVVASGWSSPGIFLHAYHHTGQEVAGFPLVFQGFPDTFVAIGDVDGDRQQEIVVVGQDSAYKPLLHVISNTGRLERSVLLSGGLSYGTAPALADLDGDLKPEIIVQTNGWLNVLRGDGTRFPGWPVTWDQLNEGHWLGGSAPVVGDIDGDGKVDIAITSVASRTSRVYVFRTNGKFVKRFPKSLPLGFGTVPAIADIDRDGRNELVVCGDYWDGYAGMYDKCWVYDLRGKKYGKIEWGQFGGNAAHMGRYPVLPVEPLK
jgi:hypothetical protein